MLYILATYHVHHELYGWLVIWWTASLYRRKWWVIGSALELALYFAGSESCSHWSLIVWSWAFSCSSFHICCFQYNMHFEAHTRRKMCSCDKFWSLQVYGSVQPDTVCYSAHSVQGKSAHTSWYSLLQCLFCTELVSMHIIINLLQCTFCTALVSTHIVIKFIAMYMQVHTSTKCIFITLCDNLTLSLTFKILSVISVFCSLTFLGTFTKLWKVTYLHHVCLSVCPHGRTQLPLNVLSWHLIFEYFWKNYRENSSFVKIGQE